MEWMQGWISSLPAFLQDEIEAAKNRDALFTLVNDPPRGKARPRFTRTGRCYTPATTRQAENSVRRAAGMEQSPLQGALGVVVLAVFPIPKRWSKKKQQEAMAGLLRPAVKPDFDNVAKLYCDALNGLMWEDDKQIVDGRCIKVYGQRPGVLVAGWQLDQ